MHKNLKRIIAIALTTVALSAVNTAFDVNIKSAYASTYRATKNNQLTKLNIESTKGNELDLREERYNGTIVDLSDDNEYYSILDDKSDGVKIDATAKGDGRVVKIFLSNAIDATAYKPGDSLPLIKGESKIYIRVYESNIAFKRAKNNTEKGVRDCKEEYTINIFKTVASSNEDTNQDDIYLSNIKIDKINNLDFLKTKTKYEKQVRKSLKKIEITATPETGNEKIYINGSLVNEKNSATVDLNDYENIIKITVTNGKEKYRTYTLTLYRGDEDDSDNEVYLENLKLNKGKIDLDFDCEDTSYSVDVKNDVDEIKITANPDKIDYLVTIDGTEVNDNDDYERKVELKEGKNTIPIVVKDLYKNLEKKYTVVVNRKESGNNKSDAETVPEGNTNTTDGQTTPATGFSSYWVNGTNGYQYIKDNVVAKNKWILDEVSNKYYYVDENGYRKTGWYKEKGYWYYMDKDGVMQTGWTNDGSAWYYLNPNGDMKTAGWFKDSEGKWYYLNGNGSMKTGWLKHGGKWYYMDNVSGAMKTGWITDNNVKYYLNDGGDMVTGSKTISGKTYNFASSGALIN